MVPIYMLPGTAQGFPNQSIKAVKEVRKKKQAGFKTIMSNQDYGEQDCCHEDK